MVRVDTFSIDEWSARKHTRNKNRLMVDLGSTSVAKEGVSKKQSGQQMPFYNLENTEQLQLYDFSS